VLRSKVSIIWMPTAVDYLMDLEDAGRADVCDRIVAEVRQRLRVQPGMYRFVRVAALYPGRRRLETVQKLYLGDSVPYHVYYRYQKDKAQVEVLYIRHVRQNSIERT
jgi:plasmid stabilization system protein ParE